ncbi:hypothetical protein M8C21_000583, partial [Ambrosia artemisiifolia]
RQTAGVTDKGFHFVHHPPPLPASSSTTWSASGLGFRRDILAPFVFNRRQQQLLRKRPDWRDMYWNCTKLEEDRPMTLQSVPVAANGD